MAKCDLQIVLDRADRSYKIGEEITGTVRVTVNENCGCRKLTIARQWYASGQGESDRATPEEEQGIFSGAWRAGQAAVYPFEIEAPPGPLSYLGALFKVGWQLRATADIPGSEATVSEDFALLPGPSSENVRLGAFDEPPPQASELIARAAGSYADGCSQAFAVIFGALALFVGVPCLAIGVMNVLAMYIPLNLPISFPAGRFESAFLIVMGSGFTALGGKALFAWFRAATARSSLGTVDIQVSPTTLRRGESATCTVRLQPRRAIDLTEATVKVAATEHARRGSGNGDDAAAQRLEQTVHQTSHVLATGRTVPAGEEVLLRATLAVPAEAPCTFWGGQNKLLWTLTVKLKLRRWPDWARTVAITVRP